MTVPSVAGDVRSDIVWSVLSGKLYAKGRLSVAVWDYFEARSHKVWAFKLMRESACSEWDQGKIKVWRQRPNGDYSRGQKTTAEKLDRCFCVGLLGKETKKYPWKQRINTDTKLGLAHVCICTHLISTHSLMKRPQTINTQDHSICNENTEIDGWSAL